MTKAEVPTRKTNSNTMKLVRIRTCLILVVMCVPSSLCQGTDSFEDEPVTADYFFNRDEDYVTNTTGSLPPGEEVENITRQVFGANTRSDWFQKFVPNDEQIASCGDTSTSAKTVWQNSGYPRKEKLPGICVLNLLPPAGTCALRIHFDDLDLLPTLDDYYSYGRDCSSSMPFFKAYTPHDLTAVYCHKLDGYEGILDVSDTNDPTILLLQLDSNVQFQFKISITAINCNDIKTYESPSDCGIKNQDLGSARTELFGDLGSEQTQIPDVTEYEDHLPLTYSRQRRRTYDDSGIQSQDQKNKNINKNKKKSNKHRIKDQQKVHPLIEEFQKVIVEAEEAGKISKPSGNRVTGKEITLINEWPWIVLIEKNIEYSWGEKYVDYCNGLLIDNSKVLTSRFCILEYPYQDFSVEDISVRIGDHDIDNTTETKSKTVGVAKVTLPIKNRIFEQKDAFAILHLKEEVELSHTIRPICLPVSYNRFDDSGVVAGWEISYGSIYKNDHLPKEAKVTVQDQASCQKVLDDFYFPFDDEIEIADLVCAKNTKSRRGTICSGDEGNSLTQRDQRGAYYVTGVATADLQTCYFRKLPSLFSKIEPDNQFLNIALA